MSIFFHVDLDAFYAAAEVLDDPSLAGRPVVVGATPGHRGVVATCSYEARRYGIHSAMPISEAYRLCPDAAFLPVRMKRYAELSSCVMSVFEEYTPDVTRVSIDEASLDMTGTDRLWGPPEHAALCMRDRIANNIGLSISIGIAANRYVAKIACGIQKPAGLVQVAPGDEEAFMSALRLKDLWGVGDKTRARMEELGIDSMDRLLALSKDCLVSVFGIAGGQYIHTIARGMDPGIYSGESKSKSVSTESTFEKDVQDPEHIEATLLGMAEELVARLYAENLASRCVVLKLRYDDFETQSIRESQPERYAGSSDVFDAAKALFYKKWAGRPLRLVGLGLVCLDKGSLSQGNLFEPQGGREARVEQVGFDVAAKGLGGLTRARLVPRPTPKKPC